MLWSALPQGWSLVRLEDVSDIISGIGFPVHLQGRTDEPIPFFKVGDISEAWKRGSPILRSANHHVSWADLQRLRGQLLPKGTTVFAKIGAAIALNRRGLLATPSLVDNNVMGLAPGKVVDERFLFHFACVITLDSISQATTVPSVRKSDVAEIPIPLPPLPEQGRIVDEVEKQFTRLDAAVAGLQRVKANLKRYRASVLKAACEGRLVLTEAELARREGRSFESGEELLKRILKERRARWEADQLAKMKTAGKAPRDDSWRGRYDQPLLPDGSPFDSLPEGWFYGTVDQLATLVQYGTSAKTSADGGAVPVLRMGNLREGRLVLDDLKFLPASHDEFPDLLLSSGDLLFNRTNSPELVGKTAVFRGTPAACSFASYLIRIRLAPEASAAFLSAFVNSLFGRRWVKSVVTQVVGQANVNGTKLRQLAIPLPPIAEQFRIVAEAERRLSVVDELEATVEKNIARCARLCQSILKMAFEGRLVPQDPNDEPASVLLERIRSTRAAGAVTSTSPSTGGLRGKIRAKNS